MTICHWPLATQVVSSTRVPNPKPSQQSPSVEKTDTFFCRHACGHRWYWVRGKDPVTLVLARAWLCWLQCCKSSWWRRMLQLDSPTSKSFLFIKLFIYKKFIENLADSFAIVENTNLVPILAKTFAKQSKVGISQPSVDNFWKTNNSEHNRDNTCRNASLKGN